MVDCDLRVNAPSLTLLLELTLFELLFRLVVSVASAQDISESVKFAQECGLKVSIKGGGHSWCGTSMRDGALALDLGGLKGLKVDAASVSTPFSFRVLLDFRDPGYRVSGS